MNSFSINKSKVWLWILVQLDKLISREKFYYENKVPTNLKDPPPSTICFFGEVKAKGMGDQFYKHQLYIHGAIVYHF